MDNLLNRFLRFKLDEGYATRMVYNVCSIPGETPWMAQRSVGSPQTNLSADYDEDKPYENLLTIRVYKEDELKINSIVEFYGVYFGRADIGDSGYFSISKTLCFWIQMF